MQLFIAQYRNFCGVGNCVTTAFEDLYANVMDTLGIPLDENHVTFYKGNMISAKKIWVIE